MCSCALLVGALEGAEVDGDLVGDELVEGGALADEVEVAVLVVEDLGGGGEGVVAGGGHGGAVGADGAGSKERMLREQLSAREEACEALQATCTSLERRVHELQSAQSAVAQSARSPPRAVI